VAGLAFDLAICTGPIALPPPAGEYIGWKPQAAERSVRLAINTRIGVSPRRESFFPTISWRRY
jgi:hypothetical protein